MYTHICTTHEIITLSHVTVGNIHIFDIYYRTNMAATLCIYVPLHSYCSASIEPTLVHKSLKHLLSDTNSHKVIDINVKKINMAIKCKLTTAMTNK